MRESESGGEREGAEERERGRARARENLGENIQYITPNSNIKID